MFGATASHPKHSSPSSLAHAPLPPQAQPPSPTEPIRQPDPRFRPPPHCPPPLYQLMFRHLFKCKWVERALCRTLEGNQRIRQAPERALLTRCFCLRQVPAPLPSSSPSLPPRGFYTSFPHNVGISPLFPFKTDPMFPPTPDNYAVHMIPHI